MVRSALQRTPSGNPYRDPAASQRPPARASASSFADAVNSYRIGQPTPTAPCSDVTHGLSRNAVLCRNDVLAFSTTVYFKNLRFSQLNERMPRAPIRSSVLYPVSLIICTCCPSKMAFVAAFSVATGMGGFISFWARSMGHGANYAMGSRSGFISAYSTIPVNLRLEWPQNAIVGFHGKSLGEPCISSVHDFTSQTPPERSLAAFLTARENSWRVTAATSYAA